MLEGVWFGIESLSLFASKYNEMSFLSWSLGQNQAYLFQTIASCPEVLGLIHFSPNPLVRIETMSFWTVVEFLAILGSIHFSPDPLVRIEPISSDNSGLLHDIGIESFLSRVVKIILIFLEISRLLHGFEIESFLSQPLCWDRAYLSWIVASNSWSQNRVISLLTFG